MDVIFPIILLILGWITLILSWEMWDVEAPCIFLAIASMVLFFSAGIAFVNVTETYQIVQYTEYASEQFSSTVVTGEQHIWSYVPFSYLGYGFGMVAFIWIFVRGFESFKDWLKSMGVY